MLIDISHLSAESDHRRTTLIADAENFRLTRLARAARRARSRDATPRSVPREHRRWPTLHPIALRAGTRRNDEAERRCAVPR